jgi:hypothetical protein
MNDRDLKLSLQNMGFLRNPRNIQADQELGQCAIP